MMLTFSFRSASLTGRDTAREGAGGVVVVVVSAMAAQHWKNEERKKEGNLGRSQAASETSCRAWADALARLHGPPRGPRQSYLFASSPIGTMRMRRTAAVAETAAGVSCLPFSSTELA